MEVFLKGTRTLIAATKYNVKAEAICISVAAVVAPLSACLSPQLVGLPRPGSNSMPDFSAENTKESLRVLIAGLRPLALACENHVSPDKHYAGIQF